MIMTRVPQLECFVVPAISAGQIPYLSSPMSKAPRNSIPEVIPASSAGQIPYLSSLSGKTQSTQMAVAMVPVLQLLALVGKTVSVLQVAVRA